MRLRALTLSLAVALAAASTLQAQSCCRRDRDRGYERVQVPSGFYAGGNLAYARPQGEFRDFVDDGFGGSGHLIWQPGRRGPLGIRLDGGVLVYGMERFVVPLSPTLGGRILVEMETTNNVASFGIGPQLGLPNGRLTPYVGAFVGMAYLYTQSSLQGTHSDYEFANTTNFDDAALSWGGRAGVYVPVRRGPAAVSLDLGLTYQDNGEAEYLLEGGIQDNHDGTITLFPVRSDTDLLTFHVGASVSIPRDVDRPRRRRGRR